MPTTEPVIWTPKEFKKATTPSNITKRGRDTHLAAIDVVLESYDEVRTSMRYVERKRRAGAVITACRNWLIAKGAKNSETAAMRRIGVNTLGSQCWNFLQFLKFAERKGLHQHSGNPMPQNRMRGLQGNYSIERQHYLQGNKQHNPISMTGMHFAKEDFGDQYNNKTFDQLTLQDCEQIETQMGAVGGKAKVNGMDYKTRVLFLTKNDRTKVLVMIDDHGRLATDFDHLINSGGFGGDPYVIDEYGNLFTSPPEKWRSEQVNHSTFNAGKDIVCAGEIRCEQGILKLLNNNSGHYKPTRANLHNAALLLRDEGVDFAQCTISVAEPDPQAQGGMKVEEYTGHLIAAFFQNMNANGRLV